VFASAGGLAALGVTLVAARAMAFAEMTRTVMFSRRFVDTCVIVVAIVVASSQALAGRFVARFVGICVLVVIAAAKAGGPLTAGRSERGRRRARVRGVLRFRCATRTDQRCRGHPREQTLTQFDSHLLPLVLLGYLERPLIDLGHLMGASVPLLHCATKKHNLGGLGCVFF
jgi:hypothetical protein